MAYRQNSGKSYLYLQVQVHIVTFLYLQVHKLGYVYLQPKI